MQINVFIINLDKDRNRLTRFKLIMSALGVPFERWCATPGSTLDPKKFGEEPIEEGIFVCDFREWSKNEAACGVSHIKLLQYIEREKIPWSIVMEDDAVLQHNVPLSIEAWDLPKDAEIILLNERASLGVMRKEGSLFSYGDVSGGAGTEGYMISLSGVRKLLKILYPLKDPLDFQMYSHFESVQRLDKPPYYWKLPRNLEAENIALKAYRVMPALVSHPSDSSSIGNERHPRARYYCKVLLGLDFESDYSYYNYGDILPSECKDKQVLASSMAVNKRFWQGVDIFHYDEKQKFFSNFGGEAKELMAILRDNEVNTVRISLWVGHPTKFTLERVLRLAKQAYAHGLQIYIVLHYSDTWADPGRQQKPREWDCLPIDKLINEVYCYTKSVMEALCQQGTPPTIVQTGNEITNGMLWANASQAFTHGGRLSRPVEEGEPLPYDNQWFIFARLLRRAIQGVRDGMTIFGKNTKVMIHIDQGADSETAIWWLNRAKEHEIDYDIIGLSFYALWHENASLENLGRLSALSESFPDKEIMLAETAYPYKPFMDKRQLHFEGEFPFTKDGQRAYLEEALRVINYIPTGTGLFWWGTTFISNAVEDCVDCFRSQALFDPSGNALPALEAFKAY